MTVCYSIEHKLFHEASSLFHIANLFRVGLCSTA